MTAHDGESLDAICERVLDAVGGRAEAAVRATQVADALSRFANSRIHQNVAERATVVSLTVAVAGGATATASTTDLTTARLQALADEAIDAARLRPPDPAWPGMAEPAPAPAVDHDDAGTRSADPRLRAEQVAAFVAAGRPAGTEAAGFCNTSAVLDSFANSAGQRLQGRSTTAVLDGIHRLAGRDGSAHQASTRLADLDGAAAGEEAADVAIRSQSAIDLDPGAYEVVLGRQCVANMLQFLGYAGFNAKAVQEGTSFVHLGEQQFDAAIDLWDDATDPRATGLPYDSEGTPCQRVELVRAGVTAAVVHDRRTAAAAGTTSTGHSSGEPAFGPVPARVFLAAAAGTPAVTTGELVAGVERGLLVRDFWYTRILDPKTQVVTGLTRNGVFLIEGGEVTRPVGNLRFTQSFVGALGPGRVRAVGSDARLTRGYHVPPLRLASWNFTGGSRG